jgi:hypothetical protein
MKEVGQQSFQIRLQNPSGDALVAQPEKQGPQKKSDSTQAGDKQKKSAGYSVRSTDSKSR